jgi:hypothetical protein
MYVKMLMLMLKFLSFQGLPNNATAVRRSAATFSRSFDRSPVGAGQQHHLRVAGRQVPISQVL